MAILFISTGECIHKQSQNLLVSLKARDVDFLFVCPENSQNAGFASAQFMQFKEIAGNGLMQYFTLKKYVKMHAVTHIHAFDENALRLALWLKKSFPALKIVGDWHERVQIEQENNLNKSKEYPYLKALVKNKFDEFHESDYIESTHIIESSARLLKEYCEENVSIVIVTNKKETIAKKCLSYFFPSYSFLLIGRTGITAIKNDHQLVKARLNELGCNTTDIIAYYGDSEEDAVLASHLQINFNKIRNCNENYL